MEAQSPRTNSRLLINESPLQVLPSLAAAIGLNEAIVLQQVHYWLKSSQHEHDGRRWIYNTLDAWKEQFPFFTMSTLRRTIDELRRRGLLLAGNYNESKANRTLWYSIDYDLLDSLHLAEPFAESDTSFVQNEQMHLSNLSSPVVQNEQILKEQESTPESTHKSGGGGARVARQTPPAQANEEVAVTERLFAIFESPKQVKRLIAAAATKRGGFTLADCDLCEAWLAASDYHGKIGKLNNILETGQLPPPPKPQRTTTTAGNGIRTYHAQIKAPDYDIHEARRRNAAYEAAHPESVVTWA